MIIIIQECIYELKKYILDSNWTNLMNTTIKFKNINKYTKFIKLNNIHSKLYYESNYFYNLVNSKIINPNNQISLNLDKYDVDFLQQENDNIDTKNYDLKIHTLSIKFSNINDLSTFKYIKNLNLTGCINIIDLSPLKNINEINLSYCKYITDVSSLQYANKVILSYCTDLIDISPLKNVKYLYISNCDNIIDISPLKNVYLLYLSSCNGIMNVSNLYNIKYLYITLCNNIIGTNELKQKKTKNLSIYFFIN